MKLVMHSPLETAAFAKKVAGLLKKGDTICLNGDLGAGKTLFVQALAKELSYEGEVTSPTFNLMNIYEDGIFKIIHFDLYRLESEEELEDIGFFEYSYAPDGIVIIEWAEKFPDSLPDDYLGISLERLSEENERVLSLSAKGTAISLLKEIGEL